MSLHVCVTGSTGFIAQQLVHQLLSKGYSVNATVRSLESDKNKVLLDLADALPGTLKLYEADLLQDGSFDAAVNGADYVFHTASPFVLQVEKDAQKELIDPAVQGSLNLLKAVQRAGTVKCVVLTSSVAACVGNNNKQAPGNGKAFTEEDWNTASTIEDDPYPLSKVAAERAAWEFCKQHDIKLCTILPSFVMGPVLSAKTGGTSVSWMQSWEEGNPVKFMYFSFVDVRDVARAHILAAELPNATGRYIAALPGLADLKSAHKELQARFPDVHFHEPPNPTDEFTADSSKIERELGLKLRPLGESLCDMAQTLLQLGVAKPQPAAAQQSD